jgi:hypothetical protein
MSGRSKPPSVLAAFSSAPNPDGDRASCCPVLACTRRDSPFHRILFVNAQRVTRMETMLLAFRLNRIMTENRPCRFCAIAVTLATRTCVRLRARWVGGLSSATLKLPSAALSLSPIIMTVRTDKHSAICNFKHKTLQAINDPYDTILNNLNIVSHKV